MYHEDCPVCIGDGYYDLHCTYCDENYERVTEGGSKFGDLIWMSSGEWRTSKWERAVGAELIGVPAESNFVIRKIKQETS